MKLHGSSLGVLSSAVLLLVGCSAAPTRSDPGGFLLLQRAQISKELTAVFTDCLMDGFSKAHSSMVTIIASQHRRSNGNRVETVGPNAVYVSADVLDNGVVELHESSIAYLTNTTGEKDTFSNCVTRFAGRRLDK